MNLVQTTNVSLLGYCNFFWPKQFLQTGSDTGKLPQFLYHDIHDHINVSSLEG